MNLQHCVGHGGEHMFPFMDKDVPDPQCQGEWCLEREQVQEDQTIPA